MTRLNAGGTLPEFTLNVGQERLVLPKDIDTGYAVILFYRGHW